MGNKFSMELEDLRSMSYIMALGKLKMTERVIKAKNFPIKVN